MYPNWLLIIRSDPREKIKKYRKPWKNNHKKWIIIALVYSLWVTFIIIEQKTSFSV
jgi:hypothetical protein